MQHNQLSANKTLYAYIALLLLLFNLVTFVPSFFSPISKSSFNPESSWTLAHALVSFLWLILLALQGFLAHLNRMTLHKPLGLFTLVIAGVLFALGWQLQLDLMHKAMARDDEFNALIAPTFRLIPLVCFAVCVTIAVAKVRSPATHMRLMIAATLFLMQATFERFYNYIVVVQDDFIGPAIFLTHFTALVALMITDKVKLGGVYTVYKVVLPVTIAITVLTIAMTGSEMMKNLLLNLIS